MKIHLSNIVPKKETGPINESQIYIPKTDMEIINNSIKEATKKGLDAMNTSQLDLIKNEIYALNNSQLENMAKEQEVRTESRMDTPKVQNKSNNDSFLMSEKGGNSSSSSKEDKNLEEETPADKNLPNMIFKAIFGLVFITTNTTLKDTLFFPFFFKGHFLFIGIHHLLFTGRFEISFILFYFLCVKSFEFCFICI
jgi:hypothetical protein